ncbi:hypothetical protein FB45DRAFT_1055226 [Roridomyces roridus]|uniref:Yeast cell wall synthesis Kre9/Knh1-like N-terminal domain-containing protein n=1 Tax=Roridomyces roridus TaxID=1738132 RepID=A0AAD7FV76_9AGAR|nr:hypothetical protein FB45DRAFT_1055226 [Roridomyces roridus]
MLASLALLAFAASVSAITVTTPGPSSSWTNDGPQVVKWTSVSTDATNFTILLTNTNTTLVPTVNNNQQLKVIPFPLSPNAYLPHLKALVNTADGTTTVNPPANGWPAVGGGYRVNLVKSTEETSTIYAQSQPFDIVAPKVSSTSASASSTPQTQPTVPNTTPTDGTTDPNAASPSDSAAPSATGSSGALPALNLHHGLLGATLMVLGAYLA